MTGAEYRSKLSWLNAVPKSWQVKPLAAVSREKAVKGSKGELLSVYLNRGVIRASEGVLGTHAPSEDMGNYQRIDPGDFILNNQQAWRGSVGVSFEAGIISPAYLVLQLSRELDWRYSNYLFRSRMMVDQFMLASQGVGSIQRQIHAPSFKRVLTIVPPLKEQESISDFLDSKTGAIDELISKKERLIELLREKRIALITQAVTKGLDPKAKLKPSGVDWLVDMPAGWVKSPLKSLFEYHFGGVWGDEELGNAEDITCIRVADFDFERLQTRSSNLTIRNVPGIHRSMELDSHSILLEKSGGGDQQPVGRAVRYLGHQRATCSNFVQKLQSKKAENPEFIVLLLSALYFAGVTKKAIKQTTGIQNLDIGYFMSTYIFLPEAEEQRKIVEFVNAESSNISQAAKRLEQQLQLLLEYRASLIYSAVTGAITV